MKLLQSEPEQKQQQQKKKQNPIDTDQFFGIIMKSLHMQFIGHQIGLVLREKK